MIVDLPSLDRESLERYVTRHVLAHSPNARIDAANIDSLCVNTLRHEHTDYDDEQSTERFVQACDAIAAAYPHLASECARQSEQRRTHDAIFGTSPALAPGHRPGSATPDKAALTELSRERMVVLAPLPGDDVRFSRYGRADHRGRVLAVTETGCKVTLHAGGRQLVTTVYGTALREVQRAPWRPSTEQA